MNKLRKEKTGANYVGDTIIASKRVQVWKLDIPFEIYHCRLS